MQTEASPQPTLGMDESCVVCGKFVAGRNDLMHIYHDGRCFTLCCPMCLQMFERARDRFARGDRPQSLLEQLLDQISWRNSGR